MCITLNRYIYLLYILTHLYSYLQLCCSILFQVSDQSILCHGSQAHRHIIISSFGAVKIRSQKNIQLGLGSKYEVEIHCLCFDTSSRGRISEMIKINIALPNGHAELLTLPPSSTVQDLRITAQRAFGKKYLRLITAKNRVLVNFEQTFPKQR